MNTLSLIDNHVWVQLTDLGLKAFVGHEQYLAQKKKEGGWYEFTLGDLIRDFGQVTHAGLGTPFVENQVHFVKPF